MTWWPGCGQAADEEDGPCRHAGPDGNRPSNLTWPKKKLVTFGGVGAAVTFFLIDRAGLLDGMLQDHAVHSVAGRRMIIRLGMEFILEHLGEFRGGRPELRGL